jgi:hypothetical protein
MLNTDRAYVLIQRTASGSNGRKGKEVKPSCGTLLTGTQRRYWEDVVLLDNLASTEVLDVAKRVIEEIGNPGETYRIVALDGPPVELACKARVTVAEIVRPSAPSKPFPDDDEEEAEEEYQEDES